MAFSVSSPQKAFEAAENVPSIGIEFHCARCSFAAKGPLGSPCVGGSQTKFGQRQDSLIALFNYWGACVLPSYFQFLFVPISLPRPLLFALVFGSWAPSSAHL